MAKRRRLSPAQPDQFGPDDSAAARAPEVKSMPAAGVSGVPIAQVAGDSAVRAALDEVADELHRARAEQRLIEDIPVAFIDDHHLVRDRLVQDADEMAALTDSLRDRGQQTPIEVVRLPSPGPLGQEYGLISGWRRVTALRRLFAETGDGRFETARALVIAPADAQAAYRAMVEENEIRAELSFYERARIALRAAEEGVYPTPRHALLGLFAAAPRAKRSKIGSFVVLVQALDGALRHPEMIPEKLGLGLARAISDDPEFAETLRNRLESDPPDSAAAEQRVLAQALAGDGPATAPPAPDTNPSPASAPAPDPVPPGREPGAPVLSRPARGVQLRFTGDRNQIELTGPGVTGALHVALRDWLARYER